MTEQLISFETAKLAKEKGFDWNCNNHYMNDMGLFIDDLKNSEHLYNDYSAPTQSLLQKWLRDVKNIDVCCNSARYSGYEEIAYYTYSIKGVTPFKSKFPTYESALEAGLFEALKLI